MKKILKLLLICTLLVSCEDVIDIDLNTAKPKLVIDASLLWPKGSNGNSQSIQLSLTSPFFDTNVPTANSAIVTVTDSNNNTFNFIEESNTGIYKTESFIPVIDDVYNLTIIYNNETYLATESMIPVTPIESVEQKNDGGFSGDEIELKVFYTDPKGIENFYLFEFNIVKFSTSYLEVYDDEFTDGNRIFAFYSNDNMELVDEVIVTNQGLSERAYEFYNILLQQTDENSGDPFQTQPATVRGNCINQTNPDNFPLGYFRVSETDVFSYIVE